MPILDPRLVRRARPVRHMLVADAVLGVVAALLVLAQAVLLARVAARSFDGVELSVIWPSIALFAAATFGRAAAAWGFEVVGRRAATDVLAELRLEVVDGDLDAESSADVATLAVGGVDALETSFARYLPQVVLALVVPLAVLTLVAAIDPVSAGIMLLTLPLVPVFMWLVGRSTARRAQERWRALSILATHFLDVVRGLPTLRAFNRSEAQVERIADVSDRYRVATMGTLRVAFLSSAVLELAATLGIALVAVTVGVRLVDGGIGFESALVVLVLAPELYLPLRNLAAQFHASADGRAVAERLLELADRRREAAQGTLSPPRASEVVVRLDGVSVTYPSRPTAALADVDLELLPGETVALVGESGAGKSTLAALLLGLVTPDAGVVSVGGLDLSECDLEAWRARLAWVPQRPTLFRGTIADNIRLGDPGAAIARVRDAAELAGVCRFVEALPDGYETIVGDGGRPVSAGQLQRIALARAFLRDADLAILDEPTANLDPASVELVLDAIEAARSELTILLITHDALLASVADRVVRLERGRVVRLTVEAA
ncbi:MAG TPA: thiol reductant ABC exporter subunit CydD [Gaiellaceae bacterium]|nr:thiol reductant ABC exporter subunit CydD [Gaiellaceae bacterium]